jgi:hypothetical protein
MFTISYIRASWPVTKLDSFGLRSPIFLSFILDLQASNNRTIMSLHVSPLSANHFSRFQLRQSLVCYASLEADVDMTPVMKLADLEKAGPDMEKLVRDSR